MIISASRRTDIPAYYSDWFYKRIQEGFVLVRNPMNFRQISRISLSTDVVDGIVFWTKNPIPMLEGLDVIENYMYYFQFSITPYGKDIEPNLPSKTEIILPAFKKLSNLIGSDRIVWRYDPILINEKYTMSYHIRAFDKIAGELQRYTKKVTISFVDTDYQGVKSNINELALHYFSHEAQIELASQLAEIARSHDLAIDTCAEKIDLQKYGISHARCIDDRLLSELLGESLSVDKDKNQRLECGCISSIDIGMYNTCLNGCRYCYANYSRKSVNGNYEKHNPSSPLVSGEVGEGDKINDRSVKSCRSAQLQVF